MGDARSLPAWLDPLIWFDPLAWLIVLPLAWAALAFTFGPQRGAWLAIVGLTAQLLLALALAADLLAHGGRVHAVGGWGAPLGIDLAADGLTAAMLLLTQAVALAMAVYARAYFADPGLRAPGCRDHPVAATAAPQDYFWPLTGFLVAGMNGLYLSTDLFNLYVTLEVIGLSAVGLVAAAGGAGPLTAALRYLLVSLAASIVYLMGVALVYGAHGTVSIVVLAPLPAPPPLALWLAAGLMATALVLKTALFPFHFWLPPAHGGAPAPVSVLLSALVVKASFYLILRLWLGVFAPLATVTAAQVLGTLGATAIVWGSWQAIRARQLKMLVAYSTVAQLGYLFVVFPLLGGDGLALQAAVVQVWSHGLAKAAMFAAAGVLIRACGHDAIDALRGTAGRLPVTLFAFGLAGVTLMGLPPSGGFLGKWLMVQAALERGQWVWAAVVIVGGLLAAIYVFRVLHRSLLLCPPSRHFQPVPPSLEWVAFALAAASVMLGMRGAQLLRLLAVEGA